MHREFYESEMNKQLLRAFKRSKLSNYRLSQLSGVSQSTIGRWVRGELTQGLPLPVAEQLADTLGMEFELVDKTSHV